MLVFGGTTEGRLAVDVCEQAGKPYYYSTKSSLQQVSMLHGTRLVGAMDAEQMRRFCNEKGIRCIVDASHPFAQVLHQTIDSVGLPVIRLQRHFGEVKEGVIYCDDYADAMQRLSVNPPRLLLALSGANTIATLRSYWAQYPTVFRVLDRQESRELAERVGFPVDRLIYYNTDICHTKVLPTMEEEKALMEQIGCDALITKESGDNGGFDAKVDAALQLGMRVYVVRHPQLPERWFYVEGRHGLRRAIEHLLPDFFPLKTGFTTGACATGAVKAALQALLYDDHPEEVSFALPDDEVMSIPVEASGTDAEGGAWATVIKDFSDDPDVTRGCRITAKIRLNESGDIEFLQGEGVGVVTLPGLGIPVGGPAINATPREMISREIRMLTDRGCAVTISVEGGEELAKRTFNAKVGVVGGISIIGTSGIVSPLSNEAFIQSISRELEVARAIGCQEVGLVGGKSAEVLLKSKTASEDGREIRCIHYGNFVGESLKTAYRLGFERVVVGIMIGKAVKLAEGHLDTHSHKVQMNKDFLKEVVKRIFVGEEQSACLAHIDRITMARELWNYMPASFFDEIQRLCLCHCRTAFPDRELMVEILEDPLRHGAT